MDALDIISVNSAKNWLNIELDYTDDDETITRLIKSAVAWVENYTSWRLFQRTQVVYNRQIPNYSITDYFPEVGSGSWNGPTGIKSIPSGLSIYLYPFTITSVTDQNDPPADVTYTTVLNPLKTLLYVLPNSVISLQIGFALIDIDQIPPPLIEACYKYITYLYENRDIYQAVIPTDMQLLINQYRRALI